MKLNKVNEIDGFTYLVVMKAETTGAVPILVERMEAVGG